MQELTELLERYRRGVTLVIEATAGAEPEEWDYSPGSGKWTARQILGHLADSECVSVDRFRRVIAEPNPTILWYDEKAWAENLDYARRDHSQALDLFVHVRTSNYELLRDLPPEIYGRTGVHSRNGSFTLLDLLRTYVEHAEGHARQLRQARDAYRASKP